MKQKYEENFKESLEVFEFEKSGLKYKIEKLTHELEVAKQTILSSGTSSDILIVFGWSNVLFFYGKLTIVTLLLVM